MRCCDNCLYWMPDAEVGRSRSEWLGNNPKPADRGEQGTCRREPPTSTHDFLGWPACEAWQWCGEFRAHDGLTPGADAA